MLSNLKWFSYNKSHNYIGHTPTPHTLEFYNPAITISGFKFCSWRKKQVKGNVCHSQYAGMCKHGFSSSVKKWNAEKILKLQQSLHDHWVELGDERQTQQRFAFHYFTHEKTWLHQCWK